MRFLYLRIAYIYALRIVGPINAAHHTDRDTDMSHADIIHAFLADTARSDFSQAGAYQTACQIFGDSNERQAASWVLTVIGNHHITC